MSEGFSGFGIMAGIGLMMALPIWAYWSQKAKIEVERERTKQLELQMNAKRLEKTSETHS